MRKNWVLVVGAIRNELYLRSLLVKLCEMRSRGVVEGIVLSTWKGDTDKCEGLRKSLDELGIILIETTYIDENLEGAFNIVSVSRQRETIAAGIRVIPNDCYVIKLRTDLMAGLKPVLDAAENNCDLQVERIGQFPCIYNSKIALGIHGMHWCVFPYDMFFYGLKTDIDKMMTPIQYKSNTKFIMPIDHTLIFGFCFNFYPFLKAFLNISSLNLFSEIMKYCCEKNESDIFLPRIILRAWGIICVFLYTQVYIVNGLRTEKNNSPVSLLEFFQGKIKSNDEIRKLVFCDVIDSSLAKVWIDEIRKIVLDLPDARGFTYEEYKEFYDFVIDKLHKVDLIYEYPFIRFNEVRCDKAAAGKILLYKYCDDKLFEDIVSRIDVNFNSFNGICRNIVDSQSDKTKGLLLEAACFDANWDVDIFSRYLKYLCEHEDVFNIVTLKVVLRYLNMQILTAIKKSEITAVYYLLKVYKMLSVSRPEIESVWEDINSISLVLVRKLDSHIPLDKVEEPAVYLKCLVRAMNNRSNTDVIDKIGLMIVDALIDINPNKNPFSPRVIELLAQDKRQAMILHMYGDEKFIEAIWRIEESLKELIKKGKLSEVISSIALVKNKEEADVVLRYLYISFWQFTSFQKEISIAIKSLGQKFTEVNFIVKLNRLFLDGNLSVSKEDMVNRDNFLMLIETLYRKNLLYQNGKNISEMCFGNRGRQMILLAFLRLEADRRLEFFSMKNGYELWMHYVLYLNNDGNKAFEVSDWGNGQTWPGADRENQSAFAAYIRLMGSYVFISIEMSAKDVAKAKAFAKVVGYEEKNSPGAIIRFETKRFPFKDEKDLPQAVNKAMDEFCKVGEKVVAALGHLG